MFGHLLVCLVFHFETYTRVHCAGQHALAYTQHILPRSGLPGGVVLIKRGSGEVVGGQQGGPGARSRGAER